MSVWLISSLLLQPVPSDYSGEQYLTQSQCAVIYQYCESHRNLCETDNDWAVLIRRCGQVSVSPESSGPASASSAADGSALDDPDSSQLSVTGTQTCVTSDSSKLTSDCETSTGLIQMRHQRVRAVQSLPARLGRHGLLRVDSIDRDGQGRWGYRHCLFSFAKRTAGRVDTATAARGRHSYKCSCPQTSGRRSHSTRPYRATRRRGQAPLRAKKQATNRRRAGPCLRQSGSRTVFSSKSINSSSTKATFSATVMESNKAPP